jgi:type IX secretion system substrate protein
MKKIFTLSTIVFLLNLSAKMYAQGVINNANIVVSGKAYIVVHNGSFINNKIFKAGNGTVEITGSAAAEKSVIGGSTALTFKNLTINKTANTASLSANIIVNGNLNMKKGNLDLKGYNIDLGSGAGTILNEKESARITGASGGNVIKTVTLNAPDAINPGNIGIKITSGANLGLTVIKRGHQQQTGLSGGKSISRYFDIMPANNANLNATLKMFYFEGELEGQTESSLVFWGSEDNGSTWTNMGKNKMDTAGNWVLKNKVYSLSRFTLADNNNTSSSNMNDVSLNQLSNDDAVIYPNPASTQFTIQLHTKTENEFSAKLSNANGNIVWSKTNLTAPELSIQVNVSNLPAGVYELQISNQQNNIIINKKIIIAR